MQQAERRHTSKIDRISPMQKNETYLRERNSSITLKSNNASQSSKGYRPLASSKRAITPAEIAKKKVKKMRKSIEKLSHEGHRGKLVILDELPDSA